MSQIRELTPAELKAQEVLDYYANMKSESMAVIEHEACMLAEAVLKMSSREEEAVRFEYRVKMHSGEWSRWDGENGMGDPYTRETRDWLAAGLQPSDVETRDLFTRPVPAATEAKPIVITEAMVDAAVKKVLIGPNGLTEKGWLNENNDVRVNMMKARARIDVRDILEAAFAEIGK